jgi:hypothetical protein
MIATVSIGALLLFMSTFLSRPWVFAEWVKVDFWMIGIVGPRVDSLEAVSLTSAPLHVSTYASVS